MANDTYSCPLTGKQCPATMADTGQIGGMIQCMWSYPDAKKRHNKCKLLASLDSIAWNLKVIADNVDNPAPKYPPGRYQHSCRSRSYNSTKHRKGPA